MNPQPVAAADCRERAVLVAVVRDNQDPRQTEEFLDELEFLAETADICSVKRFTQRLPQPSSRIYVGPGKLEEIAGYCKEQEIDLVGGDTTSSRQGLVISVTVIGDAAASKVVGRDGARPNDLICVSGDLGAAYMGLQVLEREKAASVGIKDFEPQFAGKEYLVERQLKPEARRDIVSQLDRAGIVPTSMIDISDGLSSELLHICQKSKTGCRIYEERIPIDYQTAVMAQELNMNLVTAAMNGGEDYELLFTVPLADHDRIKDISGIRIIGHITDQTLGCAMITRDGESEIAIKAQGWNHLGH